MRAFRTLSYETWDVFTDTPFCGNPLALVFGADGLPDATLLAITREFGYSETVFLFADPQATARLRIFEPTRELPFAGHPLIGTATMIAGRRALFSQEITGDTLTLALAGGTLPVRVQRSALPGTEAEVWVQALAAPTMGARVDPPLVSALSGLAVDDLAGGPDAPVLASVGLPFVCARVRTLEALEAATVLAPKAAVAALKATGADCLYLYYWQEGATDLTVRMMWPGHPIGEDPATGSAAAALTGLLGLRGYPVGSLRLSQGAQVGRPSTLLTRFEQTPDQAPHVWLGGTAVPMMAGSLRAPEP